MSRLSTSVRPSHRSFVIAAAVLLGLGGVSPSTAQMPAFPRATDRLSGLRSYEIVDLYVPDAPDEPFSLEVPIDGRPVTLDLVRHSVRSALFEVKAQIADGSYVTLDPGAIRTFRGTVQEIKGATVAGALLPNGLRAVIAFPEGETYGIEPVDPDRTSAGTVGHYLVYRGEDVAPNGRTCGVPDPEPGTGEEPTQDPSLLGTGACAEYFCTAQIACDADVEFYQSHGSSTDVTQSYIECLVNIMNVVFERDADIRHLITTVIIRTAEPDPYSSSDSLTLLYQMQAYWNANLGYIVRDTAHLFTGKNMVTVVGRAFQGFVCDLSSAYGLSNADNFAYLTCDADTVTHEVGHNWNAAHCACTNPPTTMNPDIICALRFSPTLSIPSIVTHRNSRTCLQGLPINDDARTAMSICTGTYFGTTSNATNDGTASCGNSTTSPDVWFIYRADSDRTVALTTCNSSFDTVLSVHTGIPGNTGNEIACNDDSDSCAPGSRQSVIYFSATAQRSYWIRLSGYNGATGNYQLNFAGECSAPVNDSAANAMAICPGTYYGTTVGASVDGSCTCVAGASGPDVWFSYTPQAVTPLVISTCDSGFDTVLSVHTGQPGTSANQVACNDTFCATRSKIEMMPVAGTTYYIRLAGSNGASGPFKLALSGPECAEDWCLMAREIGDGRYYGTLVGVRAGGYATCGSSDLSPDIFYRYTAQNAGTLRVDTCGTNDLGNVDTGIDTVVSLHWPCPMPGNFYELACSDDGSTCGGADQGLIRDSAVSLPVTAGQVVIIRVSRYGTTRPGPYVLNVSTGNGAPDRPYPPNGQTRGYEGVAVSFSASTFDPEVDLITYTFDWGDSTTSQSSPIPSGAQVTLPHTYPNEGVYGVTVRATDSHGNASTFSLPSFVDIADADCRMGNVDVDNGGPPVDVLFVNGSAGYGPARFFVASASAPIDVSLNPAPAGPTGVQARYGVWVWRSYPTSSTDVDAPFGIGRMCMNPLITACGDKCAVYAAKNIVGYCNSVLCSTPQATGAWPPGVVLRIPAGTLSSGEWIYVQGVIRDQSDTSGRRLSVTNAVEVMIVQ